MLLPFLSVGAVGLVSMAAHLVGDELAAVIRHWDAGEVAAARRRSCRSTGGGPHLRSGNGALRSKLMPRTCWA